MAAMPCFCQLVTFVAIVTFGTQLLAEDNAARLDALRSIVAHDLTRHVDVLADDTFEGREVGSRGGRAAAKYLVQFFRRAKLKPAGQAGSFFQPIQEGQNILGILPGSDPRLKSEIIVLGAHYDHVGYGTRRNSFGPIGYIHNGADDNASGTASMLELMEAFASMPERPRRTLLFALWDGEEKGLMGSKHWAAHPTLPLSQVVFKFNMDMVGRLDKHVEVYGSRTSRNLRRLVAQLNADTDLRLDFQWDIRSNSDHHPFFKNRIPFLMFHTGKHDDYHTPRDDAHLINHAGMERIARLCFRIADDLANRNDALDFRAASVDESNKHRAAMEKTLAPAPARFGISWQQSPDGNGLRLNRVAAGTPAKRAGLQVGDVLLEFNGDPVNDGERLRRLVQLAPASTKLLIRRGEQPPRTVEIELDGKPVRYGIAWREDTAEPHAMIVTRVTPSTPAAIGGIRVKDRILEVNGQSYEGTKELLGLLGEQSGDVEVVLERNGRLTQVTLKVPPPQSAE